MGEGRTRNVDRRAAFFVVAAIISFALKPLVPHEHGKADISWVGIALGVTFLVLALASWLDRRSRFGEP